MFNSNRSDLVGALNATTEDRVESVRQRAKDLGFTMIIGGSRMFLITKTDTGTYDVDCQSYGNTVLFESKLDEIMKTLRTRWQPEFNKLVGMIAICKGWDLSYENDCVHLKKRRRDPGQLSVQHGRGRTLPPIPGRTQLISPLPLANRPAFTGGVSLVILRSFCYNYCIYIMLCGRGSA